MSIFIFFRRGYQMALRRPLEVHFMHFWALSAKWLSGCVWKVIFCISGLWLPNAPREVSGWSFNEFLGFGCQMAPGMALAFHFIHFWALVAKYFAGRLWTLTCSISGPL